MLGRKAVMDGTVAMPPLGAVVLWVEAKLRLKDGTLTDLSLLSTDAPASDTASSLTFEIYTLTVPDVW